MFAPILLITLETVFQGQEHYYQPHTFHVLIFVFYTTDIVTNADFNPEIYLVWPASNSQGHRYANNILFISVYRPNILV